jgi:RNA polymerase sigma-70 factor (ECF subfamily)
VTPLDPASDEALARLAAAGDEQAFAQLVRRHKEPLYRLIRRYTGDPEQAYEATHEAFIAAWRTLARYDANRSFLAWLRTIAFNKARDLARRRAVRSFLLGSEAMEDEGATVADEGGADAEAALIARQETAALDRAIASLPAKLKEALLLTVFDGQSQKTAGEILGVSEKTVETRVYRARKLLAERLDPGLRPRA